MSGVVQTFRCLSHITGTTTCASTKQVYLYYVMESDRDYLIIHAITIKITVFQ